MRAGIPEEPCPDDLLTKHLRGSADAVDRELLAAHVARCGPCAAVLAAGAALEPSVAVRAGDDLLIASVADGIRAAATAPGQAPGRSSPRRRPRTSFRVRMSVLALGIVASTAFAAIITVRTLRQEPRQPSSQPGGATGSHLVVPAREVPPLPSPSGPGTQPEPPSATPPPVPGSPRQLSDGRLSTPQELLAEANRARGSDHRRAAAAVYRRLQRLHPRSDEAVTSLVSLGLLLAEADPAGAKSVFERYLRVAPQGPLVAEALRGRALTCARLNDWRCEAAAWRDLIRDFPGSLYADEARGRLAGYQRGSGEIPE